VIVVRHQLVLGADRRRPILPSVGIWNVFATCGLKIIVDCLDFDVDVATSSCVAPL
jgi:hypothetical protein